MIMDEFDKKILTILQVDSQISLDTLSDQVGLSRNACWRRVKQMEDTRVITKRVAILDPKKLGRGLTVFIQIRTDRHDEKWLDTFAKAVRTMPEILGGYRMSGELDYLLRVRVGTVEDYDHFYQRLVRVLPLSDVSASFVMEELKETTQLPLDFA